MIKNFTVTLDHEVVEKAKEKMGKDKLSPTINKLLQGWIEGKYILNENKE
jgi:hypothetical protein|tara:strand:- start:341 stop:490 length:150 start_codon:yes stop_codon:yes gene_type:complete